MTNTGKQVRLTLVKSLSGRKHDHKACVRGLGLKRMHQSVTVENSPENRGMINKVVDMLEVEES